MIPLLVALAVLLLLALLPLGVGVLYQEGGFFLSLKIGPLSFQVYPFDEKKKEKKEKKSKRAKKKEDKPARQETPPPQKGGALTAVKAYLPLLGPALGKIKRRLTIRLLELQVTWAASDPASAALGFGYASAVLEILWNVVSSNFKVQKNRLGCDVDFQAPQPTVYLKAGLTMTLGQLITLAVPLLFRFLSIHARLSRQTPKSTKKEA